MTAGDEADGSQSPQSLAYHRSLHGEASSSQSPKSRRRSPRMSARANSDDVSNAAVAAELSNMAGVQLTLGSEGAVIELSLIHI